MFLSSYPLISKLSFVHLFKKLLRGISAEENLDAQSDIHAGQCHQFSNLPSGFYLPHGQSLFQFSGIRKMLLTFFYWLF